jgi:TolB-like protein
VISRRLPLFVAAALAVLPGHLLAQADNRPGVAVMRFDNGGSHGPEAEAEDYDALEVGLQQMLLTELSQNPELRTVERSRIADITREQGLADQGLVDPSTAAEIGRLVGARYMVMGSFTDLFGDMRLDVRVVDTESGEIVASGAVQDEREETLTMLVQLADDIATKVDLPPLPGNVRDEREEEAQSVPDEGFKQYSRALMLIDEGFEEEGIQTLERVVQTFPDWKEPGRELEQIRSKSSAGA